MDVYECGSKVTTELSNVEAIITGICIRFGIVQYELSYFKDAEHKSVWVYEKEIIMGENVKQKIGFLK